MALHELVRSGLDVEGEEGEGALAGDPGIELSQRAGGEIAWICGLLLPLFLLDPVESVEGLTSHVDLSADLERRVGKREGAGNRRNRQRVGGDVLAGVSVASRLGEDERHPAGFLPAVSECHGETVDLRLDRKAAAGIGGQHLPDPVGDLLFRKEVLDREHRHCVSDLDAVLTPDAAADAERRRIGGHPLRVLLLGGLEIPHQGVVFGVADLGGVLVVVEIHMTRDQVFQLFVFFKGHDALRRPARHAAAK